MTGSHPALEQVPARLQQARAFHEGGQLSQARVMYEKVLKSAPGHFDALNALGIIAAQSGNPQRAVIWFEKAIHAKPGNAGAYLNKGVALHADSNLQAALATFDEAIARRPNYAEAQFNRGNVLLELAELDAAVASYDDAIASNANYIQAYCNRGVALSQLERFDDAVASFDRAISLRPDYAKAYFNRALAWLARGEFARGWDDYKWRRHLANNQDASLPNRVSQPEWLGDVSASGSTILLQCEQGFGDTLQFCRYAELLAQAGARVILEAQKPLMSLLSSLAGVSQLIAKGSALPQFDYYCPLLNLPSAFKTCVETIPRRERYLFSDADKLARWHSKLGEKRRPRVGLVWSGSSTNRNEHNRSFPLADLLRHLPPQFEYFRLQKDVREADEKTLRSCPQVRDFACDLMDFSDTAALCDCMDIVISTCTSVAHLSAALGRRTWVLLGHAADWRWLLDREDSPWYPTAKLYRRRRNEAWTPVFERVAADLVQVLTNYCPGPLLLDSDRQ